MCGRKAGLHGLRARLRAAAGRPARVAGGDPHRQGRTCTRCGRDPRRRTGAPPRLQARSARAGRRAYALRASSGSSRNRLVRVTDTIRTIRIAPARCADAIRAGADRAGHTCGSSSCASPARLHVADAIPAGRDRARRSCGRVFARPQASCRTCERDPDRSGTRPERVQIGSRLVRIAPARFADAMQAARRRLRTGVQTRRREGRRAH